MLLFLGGLLLTTTSCGSSGKNSNEPQQSDFEEQDESATSNVQLTQQEVEKMATLSLTNIEVDDNFLFATQRMVSIDLNFAHNQQSTAISIYSGIESNSQEPINLLEKGLLNNGNRYWGMVSVDSSTDSLLVVINGNTSDATEISINNSDAIYYLFEE